MTSSAETSWTSGVESGFSAALTAFLASSEMFCRIVVSWGQVYSVSEVPSKETKAMSCGILSSDS